MNKKQCLRARPQNSVFRPRANRYQHSFETSLEETYHQNEMRVYARQRSQVKVWHLGPRDPREAFSMTGEDLSAALWHARLQLELLLFHLETQRLHLDQGHYRWLKFTAAELERLVEGLRFETLALSVESASLASEWGGPDQPDLPALISLAPPGLWPEVLTEHRCAMAGLVREIDASRSLNLNLLRTLDPSAPVGPGRSGPPDIDGPDALIIQSNAKRALSVASRAELPQLAEFLAL